MKRNLKIRICYLLAACMLFTQPLIALAETPEEAIAATAETLEEPVDALAELSEEQPAIETEEQPVYEEQITEESGVTDEEESVDSEATADTEDVTDTESTAEGETKTEDESQNPAEDKTEESEEAGSEEEQEEAEPEETEVQANKRLYKRSDAPDDVVETVEVDLEEEFDCLGFSGEDYFEEELIEYNLSDEVSGSGYLDLDVDIEDYSEEELPKAKSGRFNLLGAADSEEVVLASRYQAEKLPAVRSQGDYNTCWAFSSIGAAEINMMNKTTASKTDLDYSEHALAHFFYHSVVDKLELTRGTLPNADGIDIDKTLPGPKKQGVSPLQIGSNVYYSSMALSNWVGATSEAKCPYPLSNEAREIPADPLCYDDEAVLAQSRLYKYYNSEGLKSTTDEVFAERIKTIKKAITDYSAVTAAIDGTATSGSKYVYHHVDGSKITQNHSVLFVGWDDNIPAASFSDGGVHPKANGAWIMRNSYGTAGGWDGYSYISYYDESIDDIIALIFTDADNYDYNYHYDGTANYATVNADSGIKYSNVFTIATAADGTCDSQIFKTVNIGIAKPGESVFIEIYKLKDGYTNPEDGVRVKAVRATASNEGLYNFGISENPVTATVGNAYSVVVTLTSNDGDKTGILVDSCKNETDSWVAFEDRMQEHQSYVYLGGTWTDLSTRTGEGQLRYTPRIKLFTVDDDEIEIDYVEASPSSAHILIGQSVDIKPTIYPQNTTKRKSLNYSNSNKTAADTKVISIEGVTYVRVTGKEKGTAKIKFTANDDTSKTATSTIYVEEAFKRLDFPTSKTIDLAKEDSITLTATLSPTNSIQDKTVSFSKDDKKDIIDIHFSNNKCTVTAYETGTAYVVAKSMADPNLSVKCKITVKDTSGGGGGGGGSGGSGGGGGGGGSSSGPSPGMNAGATYSDKWFVDAAGIWRIRNKLGQIVTNAWLCDDAVKVNGQNIWYLLQADGTMLAAGLLQDNTGNFYSLETNHNGYYGMMRYVDGWYNCNGQQVYLQFNKNHDGGFGKVINADGLAKLKAIYGVTPFNVTGGNQYSSTF